MNMISIKKPCCMLDHPRVKKMFDSEDADINIEALSQSQPDCSDLAEEGLMPSLDRTLAL